MRQSRLTVVPCDRQRANGYISALHRHHEPIQMVLICLAVADESGDVRGVATIRRVTARRLDDGWTLEVNRVATDGCPNACSALYGAAARVSKAMGYARIFTWTRSDEPGTSLRAAGWVLDDPHCGGVSWNVSTTRFRRDKTEVGWRQRWVHRTNLAPRELAWPHADSADGQMSLDVPLVDWTNTAGPPA